MANLNNMVDRSQSYQKFVTTSSTFQPPRRASTTSMSQASTISGLPTYSSEVSSKSKPPRQSPKLRNFRAAEKGTGSILPQTVSSPQHGYSSDGLKDRLSSMDAIRDMSFLRSRKRTSSADVFATQTDSCDVAQSWNSRGGVERQNGYADYSAPSVRKPVVFFSKLHPFKKREWAQILVIAVVFFLVFDSYSKAVSTTEKLEHFQAEESMMMMHLQRIEQQWIKLHENMSRLVSESTGLVRTQNTSTEEAKAPEAVDSELLRAQTQQLYQMEEELDHELQALQEKLQSVARSSIVRTFGEGPVQATLELEFPDGGFGTDRASIVIMLWYDTPHAAWTWIQQIRKGDWDGAVFERGKGFSVDAAPLSPSSSSLDFVERSQKGHEAWTVGLTDDGGSLKMFINLQDNSETRKYDVCVGKIIDGFDALQRLVDLTRHDSAAFVAIKQARAGHLARHQTTF
jgi:hypothetical protein